MPNLQNSVGAIPVSKPIQVTPTPLNIPEGGVGLVKLDAKQNKQWEDTLSMMMWKAPGMQHLFYSLLDAKGSSPSEYSALMSRDIPIACTDAVHISVNPDTFFELRLPERVFVLAHEVAHNARGDVEALNRCSQAGKIPLSNGTSLPFDEEIAQKAMDAVINAWLIESDIGEPPPNGWYDSKVAGSDSWTDVYGKYFKKKPEGDGDGKPGNKPGKGGSGFDKLAKPGALTGKDPNKTAQARSEDRWGVELAQALALEKMKRHGNMPEGYSRFFEKLLEPKITWQDRMITLINKTVGDGGVRWDVPHPYLGNAGLDQYFVPSPTGFGAGWALMWMDTSGSIGEKELLDGATEVVGFLEEVNPERLTIIWNDAAISYVDEVRDRADMDAIRARGVKGGGGTDYQPVLDWIKKNPDGNPDIFIAFTDGYVTFPKKEHPFPTIWASSTDVIYPFGEVVRLNAPKPERV